MDAETVFLIFACVLIVALLILVCVFGAKSEKKHKKEHPENDESKISECEFETNDIHVKIVDLSCTVLSEGYRQPRTFNEFSVTFETDEGQTLKFRVNEEMYNGFEKGQEGILKITDSTIYGFVLD